MKASFITPCVTALESDSSIDFAGQAALFDHLIRGGVDGVLVLGSMGEFFALSLAQRKQIMEFSVDYISKRTKVIVGTTSMNFQETLMLSEHAFSNGADAVMVVLPYYLKVSSREMFRYYDLIADEINGPVYLYNYPDRTGNDLSPDIVLELCRRHANIIGIKDSTSNSQHTIQLIEAIKPEFPNFEVFCGFDSFFAEIVKAGGDGAIGGLSNVFPKLMHTWVETVRNEDNEQQESLHRCVEELMTLYKISDPFIPIIKATVRMVGVSIHPFSTFPLCVPNSKDVERIGSVLKHAGMKTCLERFD